MTWPDIHQINDYFGKYIEIEFREEIVIIKQVSVEGEKWKHLTYYMSHVSVEGVCV